jgi:hypothetical protein
MDTHVLKVCGGLGRYQEMVYAQAMIPLKGSHAIVPPGIGLVLAMVKDPGIF